MAAFSLSWASEITNFAPSGHGLSVVSPGRRVHGGQDEAVDPAEATATATAQ
jgi:hypothetical protein